MNSFYKVSPSYVLGTLLVKLLRLSNLLREVLVSYQVKPVTESLKAARKKSPLPPDVVMLVLLFLCLCMTNRESHDQNER